MDIFRFIKLKSCTPPHVLPSIQPQSTMNDQCKVHHEFLCIVMSLLINGSLWWIIAKSQGRWREGIFPATEIDASMKHYAQVPLQYLYVYSTQTQSFTSFQNDCNNQWDLALQVLIWKKKFDRQTPFIYFFLLLQSFICKLKSYFVKYTQYYFNLRCDLPNIFWIK